MPQPEPSHSPSHKLIPVYKLNFRNLFINPISKLFIQINQNRSLITFQFGADQQHITFFYEPVMKLPSRVQARVATFLSYLLVILRTFCELIQFQLNRTLNVFTEFPASILYKTLSSHLASSLTLRLTLIRLV